MGTLWEPLPNAPAVTTRWEAMEQDSVGRQLKSWAARFMCLNKEDRNSPNTLQL